jgi:hypothetical protein
MQNAIKGGRGGDTSFNNMKEMHNYNVKGDTTIM